MKQTLCFWVICLFCLVLGVGQQVQTRFFWAQFPEAHQVFYIDWIHEEPIPMEGPDPSGIWSVRIEIPLGKHWFAYLVDEIHQPDPRIPLREFSNGKEWSVAYVGVQPPLEVFERGDGVIHTQYIQHDPQNRRHLNPVNHKEYYLGIHTRSQDVETVHLIVRTLDGEAIHVPTIRMEETARDYYRAHWVMDNPSIWEDGFEYSFLISDGETSWETERWTFDPSDPPLPFFDLPEWSKGLVIYQIFPERFQNAQPMNDPLRVRPWNPLDSPGNFDFYGGDLLGVIEGLDYLSDLGVGAIYFNPIFKAPSNHKYDTVDYYQIDPHFGDQAVYQSMVDYCRSLGIHVILDGVFNHSGVGFFAMQDIFQNQEESEYLDWYHIKEFPVVESSRSYESWNNYASLPKWNHANPIVQDFILDVARHWSETGISGWRLDAPTTTPRFFWRIFRQAIKDMDPDLLLVGEVWTDASSYFEGDTFDSTMNYLFRDAALRFIARGGTAETFVEMTGKYLDSYPPQVIHGLWNLLGSHDTRRVLNESGGDSQRVKLLMTLLFSFPGSAMIYYGDEVGLPGENDPDCRKPFPWDDAYWDIELYEHTRAWIEIRNTYPSLQRGDYEVLYAKGGVLVFQRSLPGYDSVVVGLNRTLEEFSLKGHPISLEIPPMDSRYLIIDRKEE